MEILLLKDVDKLGTEGDIVQVADGYARNYLLPKGIAILATKDKIVLQKKLKQRRQQKIENELEEAKVLAEKISTISCTIPVKVGEDDKLFGSVTAADIARLLKEDERIEIDKKNIMLATPIKSLGVYAIDIKVHPDVKGTMKLWVIKE